MRYIYKKDIKYWEGQYADFTDCGYKITRLKTTNCLIENEPDGRYALYCDDEGGCPQWENMSDPIYSDLLVQLERRPIMAEPEFSLEEIAAAEELVKS